MNISKPMNNLDKKLREIRQKKKIGVMTHVVVGYPSLEDTAKLVMLMEKFGTDIIELQIPFSDPLADGPTIMNACEIALANGTKVRDAFNLAKLLRKDMKIPILFMCYYNTIFRYGVEKFCKDAKEVGVSGFIVPDMPLDEEKEEHFYRYAKKSKLHSIQVISPESTEGRLKKISKAANGFIYCTAYQGITGIRDQLEQNISAYLEKVKKYVSTPIAVGFGISKRDHVESLVGKAEIVVIGSRIIDIINNSKNYQLDVSNFLKQINMLK